MALSDYELLAARSFEEPADQELRAAVLVCADALSQIDDPRGPLITMEHALAAADPRRAVELRRAMHDYAATEGSALLGDATSLMKSGRTLSLEWRSGKLFGISVDARYLPRQSRISAGDLVRSALQAPAASALRRLRVRIRHRDDTRSILEMLSLQKEPPPLEELDLYTTVWPQQMTEAMAHVLQDYCPGLYYVVHETRTISMPPTGDLRRDVHLDVQDLARCDPPTSQPARTFLGRALTNANRRLRVAALARIVQLGPQAKVFERVLCTLLQPGLAGPAAHVPDIPAEPLLPIVQALRAIGPSRATRRMLDKVASRPQYYDAATRSAAGKITEIDRR